MWWEQFQGLVSVNLPTCSSGLSFPKPLSKFRGSRDSIQKMMVEPHKIARCMDQQTYSASYPTSIWHLPSQPTQTMLNDFQLLNPGYIFLIHILLLSLLYLFPWTLLHQVLPSLYFVAFFFSSHLTSLKVHSLYQLFFWCGYSGSSITTYHHSICSPQVFNSIYTFLNKCLIIQLKVWLLLVVVYYLPFHGDAVLLVHASFFIYGGLCLLLSNSYFCPKDTDHHHFSESFPLLSWVEMGILFFRI